MPKRRKYTDEDRAIGLIFLERCGGDFKKAATKANVEERYLRLWAEGIDESAVEAKKSRVIDKAVAGRPRPPEHLIDPVREPEAFVPAHDVTAWIQKNIIGGGPLYNGDHWHLEDAVIGVLWTNVENGKKGRSIVGTAEVPTGHGWSGARSFFQLRSWFGELPQFIITLDSVYCAAIDDASFCALVEHELYHCQIKTNRAGEPLYDEEGRPVPRIQGHDVEEFIGVVERYGAGAASGGVAAMVEVARRRPLIAAADIEEACCGTCRS